MYSLDQRDVQEWGGRCARFPSSCAIRFLLERERVEWRRLVFFDTTYGEGRFYGAFRPQVLFGADIAVRRWVVAPDFFTLGSVWTSWEALARLGVAPDVVVADPPWTHSYMRLRPHFRNLGDAVEIIRGAAWAAERLGARYLLVHFREPVELEGWSRGAVLEFAPLARHASLAGKRTYFQLMWRER